MSPLSDVLASVIVRARSPGEIRQARPTDYSESDQDISQVVGDKTFQKAGRGLGTGALEVVGPVRHSLPPTTTPARALTLSDNLSRSQPWYFEFQPLHSPSLWRA